MNKGDPSLSESVDQFRFHRHDRVVVVNRHPFPLASFAGPETFGVVRQWSRTDRMIDGSVTNQAGQSSMSSGRGSPTWLNISTRTGVVISWRGCSPSSDSIALA